MTGAPRPPGEAPPSTLDLLETLDQMVGEARRVPFSGSVVVSEQDLVQLLDRIRLSLPQEVVQAQRILDERERILSDTEERAGALMERVEAAAAEVSARAEAEGREMAQRARVEAGQIREQAQAEAGRLVEQARVMAGRMVSEHAVLRAAEERAALLLHDAEARAAETTAGAEQYVRQADDYVRGVMSELEEQLVTATATVRKGLKSLSPLESTAPSGPAERKRRRGPAG